MDTPVGNSPHNTKWFYADENKNPVGPVIFAELQKLARFGRIGSNTYIIEANGKNWKTFASVQLSQPELPPIPKGVRRWPTILALVFVWPLGLYFLWKSKAFSKRAKILVAAGFILVCLWAATPGTNKNETTPHAPSSVSLASGQGEGKPVPPNVHDAVIPDQTTIYADEETLRTMEAAGKKGNDTGTETLVRLGNEGKIWNADGNIVVHVVRDGGPLGGIFVEAKEQRGLKHPRFWVLGNGIWPMTDARAQRVTQKGNVRHISEFAEVFTGRNARFLNGAEIGNLGEMVQAIYDGKVSAQVASRYAFRFDAVECRLVKVLGDYLIYRAVNPENRPLDFALRRDPAFEQEQLKHYSDISEFYDDIKESEWHSDDPLTRGPVVIVRMEQFTTSGGLVRVIPVAEAVNLVP